MRNQLRAGELKASAANEIVHLPVEVTATGATPPQRRQAILPDRNLGIRRQPVLDKAHLAAGPQDSARFHESPSDIDDAAQRPGHDDGVYAAVIQRQIVCRASEQRDFMAGALRPLVPPRPASQARSRCR